MERERRSFLKKVAGAVARYSSNPQKLLAPFLPRLFFDRLIAVVLAQFVMLDLSQLGSN